MLVQVRDCVSPWGPPLSVDVGKTSLLGALRGQSLIETSSTQVAAFERISVASRSSDDVWQDREDIPFSRLLMSLVTERVSVRSVVSGREKHRD